MVFCTNAKQSEPTFGCAAKSSFKEKKKKKPSTKILRANLWFILILALIPLVVLFYRFMSAETHLFNFTALSLGPRTAQAYSKCSRNS